MTRLRKVADILEAHGGIERYKGFVRPSTTPTPDDLFDVFLPVLAPSELKVLLYLVRRTFGFQRQHDAVSLRQICSGIVRKNGKRLDSGTGLSKQGAITAVKSLEARGLIVVDRERTDDGYNKINKYSLRFRHG